MNLMKSDRRAAPPGPVPEQEPFRPSGLRLPVVAGLLIIALFFVGFGTWAALAPLESAAIAPGVVTVDTKRKTVQHLEGGIVGEILVQDGDRVNAGQVLIRLDETQPRATLDLLRGRQMAASALEARLVAERDGRQEIAFRDWLLAERDDPKVAEIIDAQVSIFNGRRTALFGQVAILNQRILQYAEQIRGLRGQIAAENKQLKLLKGEIATFRELVEEGLATKSRLLELQRRAAEIEGDRSQNRAQIAAARQSIAEVRLRITELQADMISEVVQEIRDVQSELFDLAERIRAAEDVLRRTEIRAPQDGTIVGLQVHTPGGVIPPGAKLLDIVPRDDELVIEARVDPKDIDVVHPGLRAKARLTAFNQRSLAAVDGEVISVSADHLTDERTGQSYYLARVAFTDDLAEALDGASLYPGMRAEVMIVTGERTALDYLLKPLTRSLNRALRED